MQVVETQVEKTQVEKGSPVTRLHYHSPILLLQLGIQFFFSSLVRLLSDSLKPPALTCQHMSDIQVETH